MLEIGKYHKLKVVRIMDIGLYLANEVGDEVLLPNQYAPKHLKLGSECRVFVYKDVSNRLVATTEKPLLQLNEFAALDVVTVTEHEAFVDWGLDKNLFVPFAEQKKKMKVGEWYMIYLYLDETTNRLVGSNMINRFLNKTHVKLQVGEEVDVIVYEQTDLGFNVIVNNQWKGLVYANEVYREMTFGDKLKGYVKRVREDEKIDIVLQRIGHKHIDSCETVILEKIKENDGFLPLHDKSDADEISDTLNMSKKAFKKAVGGLYKQRIIRLADDGIYLV